VTVELEREFIKVVAQVGEPFGTLHNRIKVVTMDDPQLATIGGAVDGFFHDFNSAKLVADKFTRKFVMVAGDVDHAAAFARALEQLLHHVVVRLRPVPAATQLPAVDDVAHQIKVVAGVGL